MQMPCKCSLAAPTPEDASNPEILKLQTKKDGEWITVYEGIRQIPIGGDFYKVRYISDDGYLIELEKEK